MMQKTDTQMLQMYIETFEQIWNDNSKIEDVTEKVIDNITKNKENHNGI